MSAPIDNLDLDEFVECLGELDRELDASGFDGVFEIRAIGGFALIAQSVRESGVTADIDTVTPDPPEAVSEAIAAVAARRGISNHWINNEAVFARDGAASQADVDAHDAIVGARYEPIEGMPAWKHVRVLVADLETLAKSKSFAVGAIAQGARTIRDVKDLRDVFRKEGLETQAEVMAAHPWLNDPEFADTMRILGYRRRSGGDIAADWRADGLHDDDALDAAGGYDFE